MGLIRLLTIRYHTISLFFILHLHLLLLCPPLTHQLGQIIFAVNAGGEAHSDVNGISYQRDTLKTGIASDYGKHLLTIGRVPMEDQILYQTERYHHSTFGYDIPIDGEDGDYVMVLKFCEVYFQGGNMKVFDVVLNGDHTIVSDLDIYDKVGHGIAYDEIVPFEVINNGQLLVYNGQESDIRGGKIRIEFIKGYRDNPKINAIYVMKGTIDEIPELGPMVDPAQAAAAAASSFSSSSSDDLLDELKLDAQNPSTTTTTTSTKSSRLKTSGPKTQDPYEDVKLSSAIFPVFVVIGAFIPVLFCLCKL